ALLDGAETTNKTRALLSSRGLSMSSRGLTAGSLFVELISQSLSIKKKFVEADELDRDVRNLLNYGHTFGHAFESATKFKIPHGIAVLMGIHAATYFSEQL